MKKKSLIISSLILILAITKNSFAQDVDLNKYNIEKNHTSVMWIADHMGYSKVSGKFTDIAGYVIFDQKNINNSKVEVEINLNNIATGLSKFEDHLKSPDFFNVKKFSTAKFVSKKIVKKTDKSADIYGDLTLLGVTKEVILKTKFNKSAPNPMSQKPTIGFSATAQVKRSDFGMNYALPGIADNVDLVIEAEANQEK